MKTCQDQNGTNKFYVQWFKNEAESIYVYMSLFINSKWVQSLNINVDMDTKNQKKNGS